MDRNSGTRASGLHGLWRSMVAVTCAALMTLWTPARSVAGMPPVTASAEQPDAADRARLQQQFGKLPLHFIENRGQADARVAYYVQTPGHSVQFTKDGHALRLTQAEGERVKAHTIRVELLGADAERITSLARAPGVVSYFKGAKQDWKTGIPTHSRIGYAQAWPGIDLAYDGAGGKLESIYTVAPLADPAQIRLRYSGQDSLAVDADGNLVYATSLGEVKETAPIAWQDIDGARVPVETRFALLDERTVGFEVAAYDREHALVIDPVLVYGGYVGGTGAETAYAITVDAAGSAYITGNTNSTDLAAPVGVGLDQTHNGLHDVYVAKISPDGSYLEYLTYIGGSAEEFARGIAVDANGSAHVTGYTTSTEQMGFPVVGGPHLSHAANCNGDQGSYNGLRDAFVLRLNPEGTGLVYSGFIGGGDGDEAYAIALDPAGNAYIAGHTLSTAATVICEPFPVQMGPDLSYNDFSGFGDAFVAKVGPSGLPIYAGYVGGQQEDTAFGVAVDGTGAAYLTGRTGSFETTFPVRIGPDLTKNGRSDAFVAKVVPDGTELEYAGYIGGTEQDVGYAVAVDSAGRAYIAGMTEGSGFPLQVGPDLTHPCCGTQGFVTRVRADGLDLEYSGYIGGSGGGSPSDESYAVAVDAEGAAYVAGVTQSNQFSFPVSGGPDSTFAGGYEGYVVKVQPDGSGFEFGTYIGSTGGDVAQGVALDGQGNVYVAGYTDSGSGFPVLGGPDLSYNGGSDAFVVKLGPSPPPPDTTPDPFSFRDKRGVPVSTLIFSDGASITGIDSPAPISVSNGEYSIGCDPDAFTSISGEIPVGPGVCVRQVSSSSYSTEKVTTLTIGGVSGTFTTQTVDPPPPDTTPDAFMFWDKDGVPVSTLIFSDGASITGINMPSPISVSNGEYSIGCAAGGYTSADGTIPVGQGVCVRHISASTYETPKTTTLTIGGVAGTFTTTTYTYDDTPDPFTFTDLVNVAAAKVQTSNAVAITGITAPAAISVTSGEYQIVGTGVWTTANGTVTNGQQVQVRHKSAKSAGTTITTTLTVGGVSDGFSSTTKPKGGRR